MAKKIVAVCKDLGDTKGMIRVTRELRMRGHEVILFVAGWAEENLDPMGDPHTPFVSIEDTNRHSDADILLAGMFSDESDSINIGAQMSCAFKAGGTQVVALQDFWGMQLRGPWAREACRPHHICVNDMVGAQLVRKAWGEFSEDNIHQLGYPALDEYATIDVDAVGACMRDTLQIQPDWHVVLYAGQLEGSVSTLEKIVTALRKIGQQLVLIPRNHPRMKTSLSDDIKRWSKTVQEAKGINGVFVMEDTGDLTMTQLIAGSDTVISMYSTALVEAATLRKQVISVLYPDIGQKVMFENSSGVLETFPLVDLGCAVLAESDAMLQGALQLALDGKIESITRLPQEQHFVVDGGNATRVANFIERLPPFQFSQPPEEDEVRAFPD